MTQALHMNINVIQQDWNSLAGRRNEFSKAFYAALFEKFPQYRSLFPLSIDAQMERMVEMFSSLARFADHPDLIQPYLRHVGFAHRQLGIGVLDAENFKEVFIDILARELSSTWNATHESAWREAFDEMLLPMFEQGLGSDLERR